MPASLVTEEKLLELFLKKAEWTASKSYLGMQGGITLEKKTTEKECFEKEIKLEVVKNTLLKKAFENSNGKYDELFGVLENPTSIMFTETANLPAKLIKEFRKKHKKPVLKAEKQKKSKLSLSYMVRDTFSSVSHRQAI